MPTSDRDRLRVAVRVDPEVWRDEVERLAPRSPARIAAERERDQLEHRASAIAAAPVCAWPDSRLR